MSSRRGLVLAGLAVAAGLILTADAVRAQTALVREAEPNDTIAGATVLPLDSLVASGSTNQSGDLDFFRVNLVEGNRIRVRLGTFFTGFDGRLQVYNAANVVIAEGVRGGAGSDNFSTLTLIADITAGDAGTGHIRVSNDIRAPGLQAFEYTLVVAQGVAEIEPNNSLVQTQPIGTVSPILGIFPRLALPGEPTTEPASEDFFGFTTTEADSTAVVTLDYDLGDPVIMGVELFDLQSELALRREVRKSQSGSGGSKNPSLALLLEKPGNYAIRVFNAGTSAPRARLMDYSLFLKVRTGPYEQEPNQSFREAFTVPVPPGAAGTSIGGTLQTGQDIDLYKIEVPAGKMLVADLDSISVVKVLDSVVSMFLQEDLGVSFASNDNNSLPPVGASFALVNPDSYVRTIPRRGGAVYVGVGDRQNRGGAEGFQYRLELKIIDPPASESEPNGTLASARTLASDESVRGVIGTEGDVDFFALPVTAGETLLVNFNAFGIGSFLEAQVIVRDGSGTELANASSSPFSIDPFVLIPSAPATGTYSIEVRARPGTTGSGESSYYELRAVSKRVITALLRSPDIDGSGRVDGFDLADLSRRFGASAGPPDLLYSVAADVLPDGTIDGLDLTVLGDFFGADVNFSGGGNIISDPSGDASAFFGPTLDPSDVVGLGVAASGPDLKLTSYFHTPVTSDTGGLISFDTDASSLTGSLATPDAYAVQRNLGSEVEIFYDSTTARVFSLPDPRSDIFNAFIAGVGNTTASRYSSRVSDRPVPKPLLLATVPTTASGRTISMELPFAILEGSDDSTVASLALSVGEVEPTDRLPNQGKLPLSPSFQVTSIAVVQRICSNNVLQLCMVNADCGGAACVDADATSPPGACAPPSLPCTSVQLRTPDGGARFQNSERAGIGDGGSNQHNDTLARVFPAGVRPVSAQSSVFQFFTRDFLYNFGTRVGSFDPHTLGGLPPPDVDTYFFLGGEGDEAVIDLKTPDQGATFNSLIRLYSTNLDIVTLDPTSEAARREVVESDLTLIAEHDDRGAADFDPLLTTILPKTGIYIVRITASPVQTDFPETAYTLFHRSLRPDEVSVPVSFRTPRGAAPAGNSGAIVFGVNFQVEFDPTVVRFTGFDLAQGLRSSGTIGLSSAQEIVGQRVSGVAGRVRFAMRSFTSNEFVLQNGISSAQFGQDIPLARLRFRGVGNGSTEVKFSANPTTPGTQLLNLAIDQSDPARLFPSTFRFGPGVRIDVSGVQSTGLPDATETGPLP